MKTRLVWLTLLLALGITTGYANDRIKGNGIIVTRTIPVDNFNDLHLGNGIESSMKNMGMSFFNRSKKSQPSFHYTQTTGQSSLEITMDENLFAWLEIDQKGGTLNIQSRERDTQIVPTQLTIRAQSSGLSNVEISGCMNFISESPLKSESLRICISGVGDIRLDNLTGGALSCDVSGVGNAYLTGQVETGSFHVSGVGKIFAYDCPVKDLTCDVSGVGTMEVNATNQLSAQTSGIGSIRYQGAANVSSSTSGIGRIKRAN